MSHVCDGRDPGSVACVASARRRDELRAAMTIDDRLDDIKRAQIWQRLDELLIVPVPPRRARPLIAIAGVAAIAAAAAAMIAMFARPARDDRREAARQTWSVPPHATLTTALGPHAHAALTGGSRLEIVGTPGDATAVRLDRGTLLADFEGGPGRSLRVEAGGAVIEIVGTLFAIEAGPARACVSVAHGEVRVTTARAVGVVRGGETACTDDLRPRPVSSDTLDALRRHESAIAAGAPVALPRAPVVLAAEAPVAGAAAAPLPAAHGPFTPAAGAIVAGTPAPAPAAPVVPTPAVVAPGPAARVAPVVAARAPAAPVAPAAAPAPAAPVAPAPAAPVARTSPRAAPVVIADRARPRLAAPVTATASSRAPAATSRPLPPQPASVVRPSPSVRAPVPEAPAPPASPLPATSPVPARVSPPPAATPPPTAPSPSAEEMYRVAETALGAHDLAAADRALARLIDEHPKASLVDQALYERARIAYRRHAWAQAQRHLDRLATLARSPLTEAGAYLACRVAVEAHDDTAAQCLASYRRSYPSSPHDLDVLGLLVAAQHRAGGCRRAAPQIDELARRYAAETLAKAWRARCPESP